MDSRGKGSGTAWTASSGEGAFLRARTVLSKLHLPDTGPIERVSAASNEVWFSGPYVLRISTSPSTSRLETEAELLRLLPPSTLRPEVIASGKEGLREWIVVRRRPGSPLSRVWPSVSEERRKVLITRLGKALKELHNADIPANSGWPAEIPTEVSARVEHAHRYDLPQLLDLLRYARTLKFVDHGVIDAAVDLANENKEAFAGDDNAIVHSDFHFENVLSDGVNITALIDFEWTTRGQKEMDLSVLMRFCALPQLHVAEGEDTDRLFWKVVPWIREAYPELFEHPMAKERVVMQSLIYDIRDLVRHPPTVPLKEEGRYAPLNRVKGLLGGRNFWFLTE